MKIKDKPVRQVTHREVTGTGDDGSVITAAVNEDIISLTYQDNVLGASTVFVPLSKIMDVAKVLETTLNPPPAPPATPTP